MDFNTQITNQVSCGLRRPSVVYFVSDPAQFLHTVKIGFCNHPPSEGSRSLKPARPLKQESGYSDQVVVKARVWV